MKRMLTDVLQEFEPIGLEDLSRAPLMNRVDEKFAFRFEELPNILDVIKDNYSVLSIDNQTVFEYTSQYFDDSNFRFFTDHHRSIPHRYKVRIRTYVDTNQSFLEVKEKIKGRTIKKRIPIQGFTAHFSEEQKAFLYDKLHEEHQLQPVIINTYKRITLLNKHSEERLTIDFDIVNHSVNNTQTFQSLENVVIAELKQPHLDRTSPFYKLMKQRTIRPFRISKFCFGMMDVYDVVRLKSNRFKPKHILLRKLTKHAS